ncbi:aminopeptidase P N-terminal domain-containing protein [Aquitalea sp. LB_tupeE]|uniref:aminopeptidase P N-terminal domain-containing protein n=1 Tax=Aquitalea sp. LB_tupeE TaxID=2748078 RepID=UPI0015BFDE65|nr:aminopeptidase P N-terminal domain-containing protein [Aquitalea sp. LB_tupeE]NWK76433.1 aminopeptidase P N-terminal domain-containing protein [Aquitalea sp. LB_tupeE]
MYQSHVDRRTRLMQQMGEGIAILPTAPEVVRNADNHYPYRADSHFLYLTGFAEPEAVLVLDAGAGKSILFCREKNLEREVWEGFRYGPDGAREAFGFDEAYPLGELDARLPDLLSGQKSLWWKIGRQPGFDVRVNGWLEAVRQRYRSGEQPPALYHDLLVLLDEMRMIKDAGERATLRRAGQISAQGHIQAMRATRPGMMEYQVEAEILHTFIRNGARYPSYESIVAGGANACTLHYAANNARLNDGDLLLIDAGCELNGYAGDITRTFPVNGKFSPAQRDVYEIVLAAELAGIAAVKPGAVWNEPGDAALKVLVQGMLDLKLLTGSVDGVIESGAFRQFYMHGIGHMIGLDVHDAGQRKQGGQWRTYQPGMCTTIEPGLYIRPAPNVPAALHNIGIRIEDDVLVTETGHEVYTADVPKEIDAIEILMQGV